MQELIGKTIKDIQQPQEVRIEDNLLLDDNIVITFTDGTVLKLASWDYEGYSSGIYKEITKQP